MENYTLLLVDDEEEVLDAIIKKLDWEALGFTIIGRASSGMKALDIMADCQPDVIMTDIKMPYMNGLELIQHVRADYPTTKVLIFTGFDEFEYAKEALHLSVGEYILKPAGAKELTEVFTRLKEKLDREINESRNVEILQQHYQESLPLMQTNFYSTLLEGKIKEVDLPRYLANYQIPLTGPLYCCLVLHTSLTQAPAEMDISLLVASVQQQAKNYFDQEWEAVYFTYLTDTVMLVQLQNENEVSRLTDDCDHLCKYIFRMIGAIVTIGIGQVAAHLLELDQSYAGARMAVSYRGIYGASRVINIKEVAPQKMEGFNLTDDIELSDLLKKIHVGSADEISAEANKYLDHVYTTEKSLPQHIIVVSELIGSLYRFAANNSISIAPFTKDLKDLYQWLPDLEPEALRRWLVEISNLLHEKLRSAGSRSTQSLVSKAQEYVHQNYANESLSLDDVCQSLGVSNSYFSSMFKRETGKSFIGYLTDYRLDRASRLLLETEEKSYVIGRKIGYIDPNYFSYVFKRRFGLSPLKYRMGYAESDEQRVKTH
ncbi:response regulator [Lapidilactobacillus mulanensis]|uniref:Response regulator n=1 Tax=Lapidilactobacillus mulanensis TaxID=2485999 RepID=A0ABW4DPR7_9LACO|nr:response regulator [Lapidilactobacillus mulanensis]